MLAYTSKTILHSLHSHPVNILVVQQAHLNAVVGLEAKLCAQPTNNTNAK
jgi:hypothetical protein